MKDNYRDLIEDLLTAGMDSEAIYKEAKRMEEAKTAAKARIVEKARQTVVDAYVAYVQALTGDTVDKNFKTDLLDYIKTMEKALEKPVTREKETCGGSCSCKKNTKAGDPIADFLKEIGAL